MGTILRKKSMVFVYTVMGVLCVEHANMLELCYIQLLSGDGSPYSILCGYESGKKPKATTKLITVDSSEPPTSVDYGYCLGRVGLGNLHSFNRSLGHAGGDVALMFSIEMVFQRSLFLLLWFRSEEIFISQTNMTRSFEIYAQWF